MLGVGDLVGGFFSQNAPGVVCLPLPFLLTLRPGPRQLGLPLISAHLTSLLPVL